MELALEQLLAENAELSWAVNLEFGPSLTVNGFGLPFTGEFSEFDHSDYMAREEFFENIHALDLDHSGDRKLSRARAFGGIRADDAGPSRSPNQGSSESRHDDAAVNLLPRKSRAEVLP